MANETTSLFGSLPESQTNDGKIILHTDNGAERSSVALSELVGGGGGGGTGGNPYTKTTVTLGTAYRNGKSGYCEVEAWSDDTTYDLFDQDITISNNTYSIVTSLVGYEDRSNTSVWGEPQYGGDSNSYQVDTIKIKLPANTDFPMAVVEFDIGSSDNYEHTAKVKNIEVYIGETKLKRLYEHPYFDKVIVANGQNTNSIFFTDDITKPSPYSPYEGKVTTGSISKNYLDIYSGKLENSEGIKVQVNIFGNGFKVSVSDPAVV